MQIFSISFSMNECMNININIFMTAGVVGSTPDIHYSSINEWVNAHDYGTWEILTDDATSPENEYRARQASVDAINEKVDSFINFQSKTEHSIFVVFWVKRTLPSKRNFNMHIHGPMYTQCRSTGFYCITGDHTQLALKVCQRRYPKNPLWKSLKGKLLICHRNAKNLKYLKSWGIMDNVKGEVRTKVSFLDKIMSMHKTGRCCWTFLEKILKASINQ